MSGCCEKHHDSCSLCPRTGRAWSYRSCPWALSFACTKRKQWSEKRSLVSSEQTGIETRWLCLVIQKLSSTPGPCLPGNPGRPLRPEFPGLPSEPATPWSPWLIIDRHGQTWKSCSPFLSFLSYNSWQAYWTWTTFPFDNSLAWNGQKTCILLKKIHITGVQIGFCVVVDNHS